MSRKCRYGGLRGAAGPACMVSVYFPKEMLAGIRREARRIDRPLSWVMQQLWVIGRSTVARFPSVPRDEARP